MPNGTRDASDRPAQRCALDRFARLNRSLHELIARERMLEREDLDRVIRVAQNDGTDLPQHCSGFHENDSSSGPRSYICRNKCR
jgi:hypothetical protein